MKAKKGMFNDESVSYRVYWKGKRRVTVEQNIAFSGEAFGDTEVTHFEGETETSKPSTSKPSEPPAIPDPFNGPLTDIDEREPHPRR